MKEFLDKENEVDGLMVIFVILWGGDVSGCWGIFR